MLPAHLPTDARTHETAIRIARRCRHVIQACLREDEWADADQEFYRICREELAGFGQPSGSNEAKR
jgi:hypothetical protein